jgi:hypothetical protein
MIPYKRRNLYIKLKGLNQWANKSYKSINSSATKTRVWKSRNQNNLENYATGNFDLICEDDEKQLSEIW